MTTILDGAKLNKELAEKLEEKISGFETKPKLVIIQVGDVEASNLYIERKKIFAEKIDALVEHKKYPSDVAESELISDIQKINADNSIHGVIVQLPISKHLDQEKILEAIEPKKDVDGMTSTSIKNLFTNSTGFVPATTRGIISLLAHYKINLEGKKVVIVGRSTLVGKPTALAFLNQNSTVTICHSHTKNLKEETKRADILIVAVGQPKLVTTDFVSSSQVIIDAGINVTNENNQRLIVGDVDFENVEKIVEAITPVPGGVGPMTIVSLFENLLEAYLKTNKN